MTILAIVPAFPIEAQPKRGCPAPAEDSTSSAAPAFFACQVSRQARVRGRVPSVEWSVNPGDLVPGNCIMANFEFVVDTLGNPEVETIRVLQSTSASYEEAVLESIRNLRYDPARRDGRKVRQVVEYRKSASVMVAMSPGGAPGGAGRMPVGRTATC